MGVHVIYGEMPKHGSLNIPHTTRDSSKRHTKSGSRGSLSVGLVGGLKLSCVN